MLLLTFLLISSRCNYAWRAIGVRKSQNGASASGGADSAEQIRIGNADRPTGGAGLRVSPIA